VWDVQSCAVEGLCVIPGHAPKRALYIGPEVSVWDVAWRVRGDWEFSPTECLGYDDARFHRFPFTLPPWVYTHSGNSQMNYFTNDGFKPLLD